MDPTPAPRFFADCMLGKAARWLRIMGYDAAYESRISDDELIRRALAEGRVLLTRDTRLLLRKGLPDHLFIESQDPPAQVRQILEAFGLDPASEKLLSRCLECNVETGEIPRDEARGLVPAYVFETQRRFSRCSSCSRIYWRATHVDEILERMEREDLLGAGGEEGA